MRKPQFGEGQKEYNVYMRSVSPLSASELIDGMEDRLDQ